MNAPEEPYENADLTDAPPELREGPGRTDVPDGSGRTGEPAGSHDDSARTDTPAEPYEDADRTDPYAGGPVERAEVRGALEAILMVTDEPLPAMMLAQVLQRPTTEIEDALGELSDAYTAEGRGFDLREVAGGWRYYTRDAYAELVERFVRDGQEVKLTQAALETLAVVAYRQPVSRARVSAVRGVNCDGVMRTLVLRGLVEESGTEPETGAHLYRTTGYFLERLGLRDLHELPDLSPFLPDDIESLEETTGDQTRF